MRTLLCPCCGSALEDTGQVLLDEGACMIAANGKVAALTRSEFTVFQALYERRPIPLTKEQLLRHIANSPNVDDWPEIKIVDVFVCKLRKKLRPLRLTSSIETVWGSGYRFMPQESVAA